MALAAETGDEDWPSAFSAATACESLDVSSILSTWDALYDFLRDPLHTVCTLERVDAILGAVQNTVRSSIAQLPAALKDTVHRQALDFCAAQRATRYGWLVAAAIADVGRLMSDGDIVAGCLAHAHGTLKRLDVHDTVSMVRVVSTVAKEAQSRSRDDYSMHALGLVWQTAALLSRSLSQQETLCAMQEVVDSCCLVSAVPLSAATD